LLSGAVGLTLAQDDPSFFTAAKQDDVGDYDPDFDDPAAAEEVDYDGGDAAAEYDPDNGDVDVDVDYDDEDDADADDGYHQFPFPDNVYDQVVQSIQDQGGLLSATGDDDYLCYPGPDPGVDVEDCIQEALNAGSSKLVLAATDDDNWFYIDKQVKLPQRFTLTGQTDGDDLNTWIFASGPVYNGCSTSRKQKYPGHSNSRIGFVLNDFTWIGNFNFVAFDTDRWQGYEGDPLCGGAVFEAPGCADAYCDPDVDWSEDITNREGENRGITTAGVGNVFITGDNYGEDWGCGPSLDRDQENGAPGSAPQSAVYLPRVRDYDNPHNKIEISGITMYKSWADGINVHGSNYGISVHDNDLACQGDDSLAVWSTQGDYSAKGIQFYNNKLDQYGSTNPNQYWGACIALYGGGGEGQGGAIWIDRNECNSNGAVEDVKFSKWFRDINLDNDGNGGPMFPYGSQVFVTNYGADTTCQGSIQGVVEHDGEGLPKEVTINMCPDPSGWVDCPAPAFLYDGCDQAMVAWFDVGPESWGYAPGYYCDDGAGNPEDPGSIDTLMPACIYKGCSTVNWRDDWQMYVCDDFADPNGQGLTYDRCYIHAGCDPEDPDATTFEWDGSSDDGGYWHCNQGDPWTDFSQVEPCYVDSACKYKQQDGLPSLKYVELWSDDSNQIRDDNGLRSPWTGWTCAN
jgi:hypothetical protein